MSKISVTGSQSAKKHIEGDRVVGVSLHSIECPASSFVTHAAVVAIMRLCLSVCPHDKTKPAETKIAKLGTGIVHHDTSPTNEY